MSEIKVTIETTVDPLWVEFCTSSTDLFLPSYCGHWLRGVEREDDRGWIAWESLEKPAFDAEPGRKAALAAWRKGAPLPARWFRLDVEFAKRSWAEGVKWRGEQWYEDGDASAYDYVIQKTLFGEQRYE